jgi:hypothetical protein
MDGKQLREALSQDPEEGDWFWQEDEPEDGYGTIEDLVDQRQDDEPFCISRSVALTDVWIVPTSDGDGGFGFKAFHKKEDATAHFELLRKSEE